MAQTTDPTATLPPTAAPILWDVLGTIVDRRGRKGRQYPLPALKRLPLQGTIITGDAIFCQREICRTITDGGGDDAFVVKDNQPELKAAIAEAFGDLSPLRPAAARPRRSAA